MSTDLLFSKQGCYDKLWGLSFGKTAIAVPVLVICGLIQVNTNKEAYGIIFIFS